MKYDLKSTYINCYQCY